MIFGWGHLDNNSDINIDFIKLSKDEQNFILNFINELSIKESLDKNRLDIYLDEFSSKAKILLKQNQREKILKTVNKFYFGLGYLEDLINIEGIEEIAVIGLNKPIYVYKDGWKTTNISITNRDYFIDLVNRLSYKSNRRITLKNPRLNASLDNYRIHASIDPISNCEMTIRIFRKNRLSFSDFLEKKVYPIDLLTYLAMMMFTDSSIIVAGNTGSGKTSFLNVLLGFLPYKDRIVIIEETPEIYLEHPHNIKMVENLDLGITLRDLVYDTLRMRSDRTVVGEVRKPEEMTAFFDVLLSGQSRGTYTTMHGHSSLELINRMRSYGVAKEDILSIDLIIIQRRILEENLNETRKVIEVLYVPERKYLYSLNKGLDHEEFIKIIANKTWIDENRLKAKYEAIKAFLSNNSGSYKELFFSYQKNIYGYNI